MTLKNLCRVNSATTGSGTILLGSPVSGYLSFSQSGASEGQTVSYGIYDTGGTASEVGRGVYSASGSTLTRSVLKSTNSDSAINLSGTAQVFITALAEDFGAGGVNTQVQYNDSGSLVGDANFTWDKTTSTLNLIGNSGKATIRGVSETGVSTGLEFHVEDTISVGGKGGDVLFISGNGDGVGAGGDFQFMAGTGGNTAAPGGLLDLYGGPGGAIGGRGGHITFHGGEGGLNGDGGHIVIMPGVGSGSGITGRLLIANPATLVYALFNLTALTTSDRIYTFPDKSGTFAMTSDITGDISGTGVAGQVAEFVTNTKTLQAAKLIGPASNILTITNTAPATLALAITSGCTLTLTAGGNYSLTLEESSLLNQDLTTDAGPTFDHLHLTNSAAVGGATASTVVYANASKILTSLANGTGYLKNSGSGILTWDGGTGVTSEVISGSGTVFTTSGSFIGGALRVYLNGVRQDPTQYTQNAGLNGFTTEFIVNTDDKLVVDYGTEYYSVRALPFYKENATLSTIPIGSDFKIPYTNEVNVAANITLTV